jgi:amicyanin
MKAYVLLVPLLAVVLIVSGCTQQPTNGNGGGGAETTSVDIVNFAFSPQNIIIQVGDTVTWTNQDSAPHTVTSDSGSELDSELLSQGQSYSHTFNDPGTFEYHCTPHPFMIGTVTVEV